MSDSIDTLLRELTDHTEQPPSYRHSQSETGPTPTGRHLDRSFASEYLDELIIAILFRCGEANGMDIIREFTHLFGVQFSPGTVYPHLHSLEEDGVLTCRECVQTKEYRIDDTDSAREYIESTRAQISCLSKFLDAAADQ
jgi:DNA-binding PadR family transcriptional regulator